jgi:hypothetical protein
VPQVHANASNSTTRVYGGTKYISVHIGFAVLVSYGRTVPLFKKKVFICRPCPILVLMTVLVHPRRADAKKYLDIHVYQVSFSFFAYTVIERTSVAPPSGPAAGTCGQFAGACVVPAALATGVATAWSPAVSSYCTPRSRPSRPVVGGASTGAIAMDGAPRAPSSLHG